MSTPEARALHRDVRRAIKECIPRQIMIDDFWIELKEKHQEFTKSSDTGQHFGCLQAEYVNWEMIEDLKNRLAGHRGKMFSDLYCLVIALDYTWYEVWGDRICLQKRTRDSPRAMFGERSPPRAEHLPASSSGGNPSVAGLP